jgi:hypothetical protein
VLMMAMMAGICDELDLGDKCIVFGREGKKLSKPFKSHIKVSADRLHQLRLLTRSTDFAMCMRSSIQD